MGTQKMLSDPFMYGVASPAAPSGIVASLELELHRLSGRLRDTCKKYTKPKRKQSPSPMGPTKRPVKHPKRGRQIPSMRRQIQSFVTGPPHSNYAEWPTRQTPARRIFRPHKLQYEVYRSDRKVVPVLRGEVLATLDECATFCTEKVTD
jgi:hypothetical protein